MNLAATFASDIKVKLGGVALVSFGTWSVLAVRAHVLLLLPLSCFVESFPESHTSLMYTRVHGVRDRDNAMKLT